MKTRIKKIKILFFLSEVAEGQKEEGEEKGKNPTQTPH